MAAGGQRLLPRRAGGVLPQSRLGLFDEPGGHAQAQAGAGAAGGPAGIGAGEAAAVATHRPRGWGEQHHVVVRKLAGKGQGELFPAYTVILVSRNDLPVAELVRRHRGKQGRENAFKGPLIDMDPHRPPCRGYRANQAFHACGQMAPVLLVAARCGLLPKAARRHGVRPITGHLVRTMARLVRTGRRGRLEFAKDNFRLDWLYRCAVRLE